MLWLVTMSQSSLADGFALEVCKELLDRFEGSSPSSLLPFSTRWRGRLLSVDTDKAEIIEMILGRVQWVMTWTSPWTSPWTCLKLQKTHSVPQKDQDENRLNYWPVEPFHFMKVEGQKLPHTKSHPMEAGCQTNVCPVSHELHRKRPGCSLVLTSSYIVDPIPN